MGHSTSNSPTGRGVVEPTATANEHQEEEQETKTTMTKQLVKDFGGVNPNTTGISLVVFVATLLLTVSISYAAGCFYKHSNYGKTIGVMTGNDSSGGEGRRMKAVRLDATNADDNDDANERAEIWKKAVRTRQTYEIVQSACESDPDGDQQQCSGANSHSVIVESAQMKGEAFGQYDNDDEDDDEDDDDDEEEEEESEEAKGAEVATAESKPDPCGSHLIMDIDRVSPSFLCDIDRLRQAILNVIWDASTDMDVALEKLWCQRTSTKSNGVHCVAWLEDGDTLTLSTWPERRALLVDVFWAGEEFLIDFVKLLELHMGITDRSSTSDGLPPRSRWGHILRGDRSRLDAGRWRPMEHDLTDELFGLKNTKLHKREIGGTVSGFQQIDVWESINTRTASLENYERSLVDGEDNYYTQNPELFKPNRMLFLDGVLQSTSRGDEVYHETLVHPAMLSHATGPKRVAIIGGGEGATLREVLKHRSVQHCKMIEIDPGMIESARTWLPKLNDCSDFGEGNCFDESRAEVLCEDAFKWFMDRFSPTKDAADDMKDDPFDVIIMDALDPEDQVEFAVGLYRNYEFWGSLQRALTDDGILVMQLGESPEFDAHGEHIGEGSNRATLFQTIQAVGFKAFHLYDESHCDFAGEWSFLLACKSASCSDGWSLNEAQINLRLHQRLLRKHTGGLPIQYIDGAQMRRYQVPSKAWEMVFCRTEPVPSECDLVAPDRQLIPIAQRTSPPPMIDIQPATLDLVRSMKNLTGNLSEITRITTEKAPSRCSNASTRTLSPVRARHELLVADYYSTQPLC